MSMTAIDWSPHWTWFHYFVPSLWGNGPEAIVQTVVYAVAAVVFIPPIRHYIKREFEKIHHKLDHVLSGTDEKYVEPEWEEFEHWIVTSVKWITKPFRKKAA